MACRYYDDILSEKIKKWIPENSNLRVLKPEETKRLFELTANDNNDQAFKLPFGTVNVAEAEILLNTLEPSVGGVVGRRIIFSKLEQP